MIWPYLHAREVVRKCADRVSDLRTAFQALGGRERAQPRLQALLRSSDRLVPARSRACAAYLLGYCADAALPGPAATPPPASPPRAPLPAGERRASLGR